MGGIEMSSVRVVGKPFLIKQFRRCERNPANARCQHESNLKVCSYCQPVKLFPIAFSLLNLVIALELGRIQRKFCQEFASFLLSSLSASYILLVPLHLIFQLSEYTLSAAFISEKCEAIAAGMAQTSLPPVKGIVTSSLAFPSHLKGVCASPNTADGVPFARFPFRLWHSYVEKKSPLKALLLRCLLPVSCTFFEFEKNAQDFFFKEVLHYSMFQTTSQISFLSIERH